MSDIAPSQNARTFSSQQMMLCVTAFAIGLVAYRSPLHNLADCFFAFASVLVTAQLCFEIRELLRDQYSSHKSINVAWRLLLLVTIGSYFVSRIFFPSPPLIIEWWLKGGPFTYNELAASAPQRALLLALFSATHFETRSKPNRISGLVLICVGMILFALLTWSHPASLVLLIQLALQAMESGALIQYANDSGSMYAGFSSNLTTRYSDFIVASAYGTAAYIPLTFAFRAFVARVKKRLSVVTVGLLLTLTLGIAAIYPVWLYTNGINQLCPPFAAALWQTSLFNWVAASFTVVILCWHLAMRICEIRLPSSTQSRRETLTHIAAGVASTVWLLHQFPQIPNFWVFVESLLFPSCFISIAIWITAARRLASPWTVNEVPQQAETTARHFAATFFALLGLVVVVAPGVFWIVYSWILAATLNA